MQGMDSSMFRGQHFIDANGALIPQSQVISTTVRDGRTVTSIITPNVVDAVQRHLDCSSVQGAELEDDGGSGSAGSHWEQRLFEGPWQRLLGLGPMSNANDTTPTAHARVLRACTTINKSMGNRIAERQRIAKLAKGTAQHELS